MSRRFKKEKDEFVDEDKDDDEDLDEEEDDEDDEDGYGGSRLGKRKKN